MRIRLESIGCRLNTGEIESVARKLLARGHLLVGPNEPADLCIVNTCTVTAVASRKSRKLIHRLRRSCPEATVVATGCYSELEPEAARELGVDWVIRNLDKDRLTEQLEERGLLCPGPVEPGPERVPGHGHTRAFVKVQDGCDHRCAFCVVTVARGQGRSRDADEVVAEIIRLNRLGYREAVLSGVHLGSYGHDLGRRQGLCLLVRRILVETTIPRIRLSSLEPWDLEPELFELFASPRLLPHLHLPVQSGCDATLRRMARRTSRAELASLVELARATIPGVAISTDVIAGFPGETDEDFATSFDFIEAQAFSRLHVFRFSPRPGTAAATMPDQVPGPVAQQRSRRLLALGERLAQSFADRFVGSTVDVLWEESRPAARGLRWSGLSDHYVRVFTETLPEVDLANQITATEILAPVDGGLAGRPVG